MKISDEIKAAKKLSKVMSKVTSNIDKIILDMASSTETSNLFWYKIQIELKKEFDKARLLFPKLSSKMFTIYYNKSLAEVLNKVNKSPYIKGKFNIGDFKNKDINKQAIKSIIQNANVAYITGLNSGQKELQRLGTLLQQKNIGQKEIENLIKTGIFDTGLSYKANAQEIKKLLRKALDSKYITITDVKGNLRNYKVSTYTDMLVRTKLRETNTIAVTNTALSVGSDLVQVSSHNTLTPFDAQFEGKIYSLSGNDKDFEQATFLPPFHPNCLHVITVVFKEYLEQTGILDKSIAFSNGSTEIHPTRTSHIPVSDRRL